MSCAQLHMSGWHGKHNGYNYKTSSHSYLVFQGKVRLHLLQINRR